MPFAGDDHVVVAVQSQVYRLAGFVGEQCSDAGEECCLSFLSPEAATHTSYFDSYGVVRSTQHLRNRMLHFSGVLR